MGKRKTIRIMKTLVHPRKTATGMVQNPRPDRSAFLGKFSSFAAPGINRWFWLISMSTEFDSAATTIAFSSSCSSWASSKLLLVSRICITLGLGAFCSNLGTSILTWARQVFQLTAGQCTQVQYNSARQQLTVEFTEKKNECHSQFEKYRNWSILPDNYFLRYLKICWTEGLIFASCHSLRKWSFVFVIKRNSAGRIFGKSTQPFYNVMRTLYKLSENFQFPKRNWLRSKVKVRDVLTLWHPLGSFH